MFPCERKASVCKQINGGTDGTDAQIITFHMDSSRCIALNKVQEFALHGTAKGPHDILRKKRIQELLGLS
jgi:hypothetical protein